MKGLDYTNLKNKKRLIHILIETKEMDSFGEQKSTITDASIHLYSLPQQAHWGLWILCRLPLPDND